MNNAGPAGSTTVRAHSCIGLGVVDDSCGRFSLESQQVRQTAARAVFPREDAPSERRNVVHTRAGNSDGAGEPAARNRDLPGVARLFNEAGGRTQMREAWLEELFSPLWRLDVSVLEIFPSTVRNAVQSRGSVGDSHGACIHDLMNEPSVRRLPRQGLGTARVAVSRANRESARCTPRATERRLQASGSAPAARRHYNRDSRDLGKVWPSQCLQPRNFFQSIGYAP